MSESTSEATDQDDLFTRRDERPEVAILLSHLKRDLPALTQQLAECDERFAEDCIYRFYHGSFKVYRLQGLTEHIVDLLQRQMPDCELDPYFCEILRDGTGLSFERRQPKRWIDATRHILEAYFHARYFLEMAVKYGRELEYPPSLMPSGWAALLYFYNLS